MGSGENFILISSHQADFETDGPEERLQVIADALIEVVEGPLDECHGAGTPQCARRDDLQRRLISFRRRKTREYLPLSNSWRFSVQIWDRRPKYDELIRESHASGTHGP
jgi:hypothetical protein